MKGKLSKEKEIAQVEIQKYRSATVEEALDFTGKYNYILSLKQLEFMDLPTKSFEKNR